MFGRTGVGLHTAVFIILLGLFSVIAWFQPIERPASDVFWWLPIIFVLYLGVWGLVQYYLRRRHRT